MRTFVQQTQSIAPYWFSSAIFLRRFPRKWFSSTSGPSKAGVVAARSLLDEGVEPIVQGSNAEVTVARLRAVWTALKELDPSNMSTSGQQCAPLEIPPAEELEASRSIFESVFAGLDRTVESYDSIETLAELERRGDSLAYGEIKFEGIAGIFGRLRKHGFPPAEGNSSFVDIGSGIGNVAIAAALIEPRLTFIKGVEVLPELHRVSEQARERYLRTANSAPKPHVVFDCGDAAQANWAPQKHTSLVMMHATGFSDELMLDLSKHAERNMEPGSLVVSLTLRMPSAEFEFIDTFEVPCSWGQATAKVHRRLGGLATHEPHVPIGITGLVENQQFLGILCTCITASDGTIAREAAATLGFAARVERTARQLIQVGVVPPLVNLLRRGIAENPGVDTPEVLVPMHAAAILAVRSIGSHVYGQESLAEAGALAALRTLAARSPNAAVRAAALSCSTDVFDDF